MFVCKSLERGKYVENTWKNFNLKLISFFVKLFTIVQLSFHPLEWKKVLIFYHNEFLSSFFINKLKNLHLLTVQSSCKIVCFIQKSVMNIYELNTNNNNTKNQHKILFKMQVFCVNNDCSIKPLRQPNKGKNC